MVQAGLATSVSLARPLWRRAVAAGIVSGEPSSLATEALDAIGLPRNPASRAATLPGPITLADLARIERHVDRAWGDGLVDLQAKQDAAYLQECAATIRTAAAERWTPERFRSRIGTISEDYGVRGWGSKASTWYRTLILNSGYNRGQLLAYAGTPAKRLFPYLTLRTRGDEAVRASHRLLDGFVARVDWSGWNTFTPPLDWGCRCKLLPISWEVADAAGYTSDFPRGKRFLSARKTRDDDGVTRKVRPGSPAGFAQPLQVFNDVLPFGSRG